MIAVGRHPIRWQAPRPLWRGTTPFAAAPQILRFASDDFMDQMLATLAEDPARLAERIATPETWRDPPRAHDTIDPIARVPLPAPVASAKRRRLLAGSRPAAPPLPAPAARPLKLYAPAHQRYYLVAGSLTCAIPGLPERAVAGSHETVHFVLRRLLPAGVPDPYPAPPPAIDAPRVEFAFVKHGDDASWQRVSATDPAVLAPGEELLPLFPLAHADTSGHARTLWSGLIPVGRREDYLAKPVSRNAVTLADGQLDALRPASAPAPPNSKQARLAHFRLDVAEPWKAMVRAAVKASEDVNRPTDPATKGIEQRPERVFGFNLQFQMQSWLILLDFADWLRDWLPNLWQAVQASSAAGLSNEAPLYNWLDTANAAALAPAMRALPPLPPGVSPPGDLRPMLPSLRAALAAVPAYRTLLEAATTHYTSDAARALSTAWPPFHFPLAGLDTGANATGPFTPAPIPNPATDPATPPPIPIVSPIPVATGTDLSEALESLVVLVGLALTADSEATARPLPFAMKVRDAIVATSGDPGVFVIRMVHLNRDCGPLDPPHLSAPTERFQLASFFDSDAPVRPIRITLPMDTSPAGLRKHGRGTAFVLSDMLCGQVQRAKGMGFVDLVLHVLPWPFHKSMNLGDGGPCKGNNGLEIGMICSLSIPIITICAFILLIIMVLLFDFAFRWMPWFINCFPVPRFKGKAQ